MNKLKITKIYLVAIFATTFATGPLLAESSGGNVLLNGGFEDTGEGPGSGWTFEGECGPACSFAFNNEGLENTSPFGWWSAFIKDNSLSNAMSTPITLRNGCTYKVTFWATVPWTQFHAPVTLSITDGSNKIVWEERFNLDEANRGNGHASELVKYEATRLIEYQDKSTSLGTESSGLVFMIRFDEKWGGNDVVFDNIEVSLVSSPKK